MAYGGAIGTHQVFGYGLKHPYRKAHPALSIELFTQTSLDMQVLSDLVLY